MWGGAVDNLGGRTLSYLARTVRPRGNIACIGLVEASTLQTTVMPLILRGVSLLGIHSSEVPREWRISIWEKLASEWMPKDLLKYTVREVIDLADVPRACDELVSGNARTRFVVPIGGDIWPEDRVGLTLRFQGVIMNTMSDDPTPAKQATATVSLEASPPLDPMSAFTAFTQQMTLVQRQILEQMAAFWTGAGDAPTAPTLAAQKSDKRFAADAWRKDPSFDLLRQTYLGYSDYLNDAVEAMALDERTKSQMRYGMRQLIDAMSPSNFLITNPEALQLAVDTGGQSLAQGMGLFLEDLAKGRVSSTDERAYEVGKDIAATPGTVIFENELMQLIQYAPTTETVSERPLLMIPPCINKFYILDLQPENSLVRYIVSQGNTVFMVSWRNIGPAQSHLQWDDYLEQGVMKAIEVALSVSGADKLNTLGFCIGGTLLVSALAVTRARGRMPAASMTLLTTMLDFTDTGEIGVLVSDNGIAAREAAIGAGGLMPGKDLAFAFSSLRANDLIWQYVVNSYLKGKAPPAFDLLYWNADSTNLPGPMFCWYMRNTYLENNLRIPDKTIQCGEPVNLSRINVPTFIYASREDHIVPWRTAFESTQLLAGDTTFVLGASGHIAGVINPASKHKRNHWVAGEVGTDPDRWLENAQDVPGSWWPRWIAWLRKQAGADVPAPTKVGNPTYSAIEAAPGRYVKVKDSEAK